MMARTETEQGLDISRANGWTNPAASWSSTMTRASARSCRRGSSRWVRAGGRRGAEEALAVAAAQGVASPCATCRCPGTTASGSSSRSRHAIRTWPWCSSRACTTSTGRSADLQHGVVDYLLKPFDQRSLSRALENAMRQHLCGGPIALREQRASELGVRHARLVQAMTRLQIETTGQVEAVLDLVAFRSDVWREHSHRVRRLAVALATTLRAAGEPGGSTRTGRAAA